MRTITQHTGMWPIFSNTKCAFENLVISEHCRMGRFVRCDVLSPGPFLGTCPWDVPWDVFSLGPYVHGTYCPVRRTGIVRCDVLSRGTLCPWDDLSSGTFCLVGRFALGRFVCAPYSPLVSIGTSTLRVVENRADSQLVARLRRDCPRQLACQAAVDPPELARGS